MHSKDISITFLLLLLCLLAMRALRIFDRHYVVMQQHPSASHVERLPLRPHGPMQSSFVLHGTPICTQLASASLIGRSVSKYNN